MRQLSASDFSRRPPLHSGWTLATEHPLDFEYESENLWGEKEQHCRGGSHRKKSHEWRVHPEQYKSNQSRWITKWCHVSVPKLLGILNLIFVFLNQLNYLRSSASIPWNWRFAVVEVSLTRAANHPEQSPPASGVGARSRRSFFVARVSWP